MTKLENSLKIKTYFERAKRVFEHFVYIYKQQLTSLADRRKVCLHFQTTADYAHSLFTCSYD